MAAARRQHQLHARVWVRELVRVAMQQPAELGSETLPLAVAIADEQRVKEQPAEVLLDKALL